MAVRVHGLLTCPVCGRRYRVPSNYIACLVGHKTTAEHALAETLTWEQEVEPGGVEPY